jgi:hypothetical protein
MRDHLQMPSDRVQRAALVVAADPPASDGEYKSVGVQHARGCASSTKSGKLLGEK